MYQDVEFSAAVLEEQESITARKRMLESEEKIKKLKPAKVPKRIQDVAQENLGPGEPQKPLAQGLIVKGKLQKFVDTYNERVVQLESQLATCKDPSMKEFITGFLITKGETTLEFLGKTIVDIQETITRGTITKTCAAQFPALLKSGGEEVDSLLERLQSAMDDSAETVAAPGGA